MTGPEERPRLSGLFLVLAATLLVAGAVLGQEVKPRTRQLTKAEQLKAHLTDFVDLLNDGGVNANTKRYLRQNIMRAERYIETGNMRNARSQFEGCFSYEMPSLVAKELKALMKIFEEAAKERRKALAAKAKKVIAQVKEKCRTAKTEEAIQELMEKMVAIEHEISRSYSSSDDVVLQRWRRELQQGKQFLNRWLIVLVSEETKNYSKALEELNRMISSSSSYYRFLPMKDLQKKQAAMSKSVIMEADKELNAIKEKVAAAKTAKEVQLVAGEFQVFYNRYRQAFYNTPRYNALSQAQQALNYWQNVVSAEEAGQISQALQALRSLESGSYRNTELLGWKEISAKKASLIKKLLEQDEAPDDPVIGMITEQLKKIKTVEELLKFKDKLQPIMNNSYSSGRSHQELQYLQMDIQMVATSHQSLKNRQFSRIFQYIGSSQSYVHRWKDKISKFRDAIMLKAIVAVCDLDEEKLKQAGKTADKALLAFADEAAAGEDWEQVHRYLDAYRMAFFPSQQQPGWLAAELTACQSLISGIRFEEAEQYRQAAQAYMNVLMQIGKRIPTEEATDRLRKLKKAHPEAIEGIDISANGLRPMRNSPMAAPMPVQAVNMRHAMLRR